MLAPEKFFVVAIGFSAGGVQDLYHFFSYLPKLPNAAFVVIQHLSRDHISIADLLLAKHTNLPVSWAEHEDLVQPNHVYLLAPNMFITMENGHLHTRTRDPADRSNWAVDIFFHSMADDVQGSGIGIILSGAGSDGAEGAIHVHEQGGIIMVQDPGTALFEGMPLSAIIKDSPDQVLSPRKLAYALMDYLHVHQPV